RQRANAPVYRTLRRCRDATGRLPTCPAMPPKPVVAPPFGRTTVVATQPARLKPSGASCAPGDGASSLRLPSGLAIKNSGRSSGQLDSGWLPGRTSDTANMTSAMLRIAVPGRVPRRTVTENLKLSVVVAEPGLAGCATITVEGPSARTLTSVPPNPSASLS